MARKMKEDGLILFREIEYYADCMTNEQFGALIRALIRYRFHGEYTQFDDPLMKLSMNTLASQIKRVEEYCEENRDRANRRWEMERQKNLQKTDTANGHLIQGVSVDTQLENCEDFLC